VAKPALLTLTFAGGLNENQTPNLPECQEGYNFELAPRSDKLIPRKPFDLSGTAPNAGKITGFAQLVVKAGTKTTLVVAGAVVYLWDGVNFTSKGSVTADALLRDVYWALGDYLLLTDINKKNVLQKWDGTTLSNATTGLGGTALYAKYAIVKDGRVWLGNVTAGSDTPHMILASAFEDPTNLSISSRAVSGTFTTGLEPFYMLSPDLKPINGLVLFQNQLVMSTVEGRLFKLTGSSAKDYAWTDFYDGSAALGDESLVIVGNDVLYLRKGGNIGSLGAVQSFGDVKAVELSRWIPKKVANLASVLAVYDQTNQKAAFFCGNGDVLVVYKDLLYAPTGENPIQTMGLSPWSVYRTNHSSNFVTAATKYMYHPGAGDNALTVYFGDASGHVFDLNGSGDGDAGSVPISILRTSKIVDAHDFQNGIFPWDRRTPEGEIQYRRIAAPFDVTISLDWEDEYNTTDAVVALKGPPVGDTGVYWGDTIYWSDSNYYSEGFAFAAKASHQTFSNAGRGPGFTISVSASTTGQFQIDNIAFF
jgi:hypothetical protein